MNEYIFLNKTKIKKNGVASPPYLYPQFLRGTTDRHSHQEGHGDPHNGHKRIILH